jgi:hypothetical protein
MPLLPRRSYLSLTPSITMVYAFLQAPSERAEWKACMQSQGNRRSPPGGKSYCAIMPQNLVLSRNTILWGNTSTLSRKKICSKYQSQLPGRHQVQRALGFTPYRHTPIIPLKMSSIPPWDIIRPHCDTRLCPPQSMYIPRHLPQTLFRNAFALPRVHSYFHRWVSDERIDRVCIYPKRTGLQILSQPF